MAFLSREWLGIQQFPTATQTKLHEILGRLRQENVNTMTILVMGKGGVGKSSTVNSILGERVATVSAFQSEGLRPIMCSRTRAGFTLNVIDTPGIVEGGYVNEQALDIIKRFLLNKTIDVLLYVDRLDSYRVDNLDRQVVKAITGFLGKGIWERGAVVLTHAQLSPPDGLNYDDFLAKRSEALLKFIRLGAGIKKQEYQEKAIPVALVENSGRCKTNEDGEKILPNGTTWISSLVQTITHVITNGGESVTVDQKLIDGPDPNNRGKIFIPLILAFQDPSQNGILAVQTPRNNIMASTLLASTAIMLCSLLAMFMTSSSPSSHSQTIHFSLKSLFILLCSVFVFLMRS